jgi:D-serine deaminase-like pyridoxal phosphate-dependent protein
MEKDELIQIWAGRKVEELPTPVIVADIEKLNENLFRMDHALKDSACRLRPHFKSHKCVELARRQVMMPHTCGITCAKTSEAEELVKGGLTDIIIANQVIGQGKTDRIAELNRKALVRVAVDSTFGIQQLAASGRKYKQEIGVLIEVNIGMNRGGVEPGRETLELAKFVKATSGIRLDGIQAYEGHITMLESAEKRKRLVKRDMQPLITTRELLESEGFSIFISSGGTGTYDMTGKIKEINELQCGSYALMDSVYKKIKPEFENARYILATISTVRSKVAVADVGLKGVGNEYGLPQLPDYPEAEILYLAEEHMVIRNIETRIGEKIKIIPPHGCTTNNLYSQMWISRNGIIEDLWEIEGRGCLA